MKRAHIFVAVALFVFLAAAPERNTVTLLVAIGFVLLMSWLVFKAIRRDIPRGHGGAVPGSDDDEKDAKT